MKYRKKPVVIDAIQWNNVNRQEIFDFVGKDLECELESQTAYLAGKGAPQFSLIIPTLEGNMKASNGDWIIKGVNGEFYPCKPDIFAKAYEPASQPSAPTEAASGVYRRALEKIWEELDYGTSNEGYNSVEHCLKIATAALASTPPTATPEAAKEQGEHKYKNALQKIQFELDEVDLNDVNAMVQSIQLCVDTAADAFQSTPLPASTTLNDERAKDELTIEDYKAVVQDHSRLVRELDILLNGANAAKQASLCDIVAQLSNKTK